MSQISRAFFGALGISLALGAVQFASGHDLTGGVAAASGVSQTGVNRAAKADRAGPVAAAEVPTRTISLRLDSLADTSVVIRIPLSREARNATSPKPIPAKPVGRKLAIACEPVVSTLTEVAKLLQPGRCVT